MLTVVRSIPVLTVDTQLAEESFKTATRCSLVSPASSTISQMLMPQWEGEGEGSDMVAEVEMIDLPLSPVTPLWMIRQSSRTSQEEGERQYRLANLEDWRARSGPCSVPSQKNGEPTLDPSNLNLAFAAPPNTPMETDLFSPSDASPASLVSSTPRHDSYSTTLCFWEDDECIMNIGLLWEEWGAAQLTDEMVDTESDLTFDLEEEFSILNEPRFSLKPTDLASDEDWLDVLLSQLITDQPIWLGAVSANVAESPLDELSRQRPSLAVECTLAAISLPTKDPLDEFWVFD